MRSLVFVYLVLGYLVMQRILLALDFSPEEARTIIGLMVGEDLRPRPNYARIAELERELGL